MSRLLLGIISLSLSPLAIHGDEEHFQVIRVFAPDGKPAVNAKVWIYEERKNENEEIPEPQFSVTDAQGQVRWVIPAGEKRQSRQLFVRDTQGRIGSGHLFFRKDQPLNEAASRISLIPLIERSGSVTDPSGKLLPDALITPIFFYADNPAKIQELGLPRQIYLPPWEQKRLSVKSDSGGRFILTVPTDKYDVQYQIQADGHGLSKWLAPPGLNLDTKLLKTGSITITATGANPQLAKGTNFRLIPTLEKDSQKKTTIRPFFFGGGSLDGQGKATLAGVVSGKYTCDFPSQGQVPVIFEKIPPVEVLPDTNTMVHAPFGPAALATGTVLDKTTGKGIPGVQVYLLGMAAPGSRHDTQLFVRTNETGKFQAYGPFGYYRILQLKPPAGYAQPPTRIPKSENTEPILIQAGKTHEFPPVTLEKSVEFTGIVVHPDGAPVSKATIDAGLFPFMARQEGLLTTDHQGRFILKDLPSDDSVSPRVRKGKAVNLPRTFVLSKVTGPEKIEISEANAARFQGRVVDRTGHPVADAKVQLVRQIDGVGRASLTSMNLDEEASLTGPNGEFLFEGQWPKDFYSLRISASGYATAEARVGRGEPGQVLEIPPVKLIRDDLSVRGNVVGLNGQPLPGVELHCLENLSPSSTRSRADGSFSLSGFRDHPAFLFAQKSGFRPTAVPVFPSRPEAVTVKMTPNEAPPPPAPSIPAGYLAAREDLTRHLFTRLWENRDQLNSGAAAINGMAQIDRGLAKQWRDEEKARTAGKKDYSAWLNAAGRQDRLVDLSKTDIDESVEEIKTLKGRDGFTEAAEIAKRLLSVDKAKALRFAEEAVVKARQMDSPDKVWALAEAGYLATQAGSAGGRKILAEAGDLAAKITPDENGRNGFAIGMVAARLAPYDWPKAEALLNLLKDPGDYNRFLTAAVTRVAEVDFPRAEGMMGKFKFERITSTSTYDARIQMAFTIALREPNKAFELVQANPRASNKVRGLIHLAERFGTQDQANALKAINQAFDLMDNDPGDFDSWSNYGSRIGFALVALFHAKRAGHPDLATLEFRAMAMRPTARENLPERLNEQLVTSAAALALVDPSYARHQLAGIAPPEEYPTLARNMGRNWLFALALADPERAKILVDKKIEWANSSNQQKSLGQTGLMELGSILTAKNTLAELMRWGSFPMSPIED